MGKRKKGKRAPVKSETRVEMKTYESRDEEKLAEIK